METLNAKIAAFMGLTCVKQDGPNIDWEWLPTPSHSNWCSKSAPPYDRSWSWLMPVVEKIEGLGNDVSICQWGTQIKVKNEMRAIVVNINEGSKKIGSVYDAIIKYIEMYQPQYFTPRQQVRGK